MKPEATALVPEDLPLLVLAQMPNGVPRQNWALQLLMDALRAEQRDASTCGPVHDALEAGRMPRVGILELVANDALMPIGTGASARVELAAAGRDRAEHLMKGLPPTERRLVERSAHRASATLS